MLEIGYNTCNSGAWTVEGLDTSAYGLACTSESVQTTSKMLLSLQPISDTDGPLQMELKMVNPSIYKHASGLLCLSFR